MSRRIQATDFDLNLAPIIDCFTVLITFLLASAAYLSVSIFDAGFAPSAPSSDVQPPPITVEITLRAGDVYQLVVDGKMKSDEKFKSPEEVTEKVKEIRTRFPSIDSVTILAEDNISYEAVVRTMEKLRPVMPSLVLGGF